MSIEEWETLSAPLREAEDRWARFARLHGMRLEVSKKWPAYSLEWSSEPTRKIQVHLVEKVPSSYCCRVTAWVDKSQKRFFKDEVIEESLSAKELNDNLEAILDRAQELCQQWSIEDLSPV